MQRSQKCSFDYLDSKRQRLDDSNTSINRDRGRQSSVVVVDTLQSTDRLEPMSVELVTQLRVLASCLNSYQFTDQWKQTFEGRRPELGATLFRRLGGQFYKNQMSVIVPFFFEDSESQTIKEVRLLQSRCMFDRIFTHKLDASRLDRDGNVLRRLLALL